MVGIVIAVRPFMVAVVASVKVGNHRNEVRINSVAQITAVAGKISVFGIAVRIKCDFPMGHSFRSVDGKFETAIKREIRTNDLFGIGGALHQILPAVDVTFGDQVGDYVLAAFHQLFRSELVRFVRQREQGGGGATCRSVVVGVFLRDTARSQEGKEAKNKKQDRGRKFHNLAGMDWLSDGKTARRVTKSD